MKGFHLVFKRKIDGLEDLGRDFLGLKGRLCKWEKRVKMGKFAGIQRGKGGLLSIVSSPNREDFYLETTTRILQRVKDTGDFKNDMFSGEMYFLKTQKQLSHLFSCQKIS